MKILLYCTKAKPYLRKLDNYFLDNHNNNYYWKKEQTTPYSINGKIVAECDFEVEEITPNNWNAETEHRILKGSCLKEYQLFNYIIKGDENEKQNPFYAIHIKNLNIFDEPKELSSFSSSQGYRIFKAPQNMQKVYEYTNRCGNEYILISIKPQHLVNILNGNKTIELRKKVLKEMLK